ncbi:MAG: hypothetical protein ACRCUS_08830 [Anaerovoracaceae bacterium]
MGHIESMGDSQSLNSQIIPNAGKEPKGKVLILTKTVPFKGASTSYNVLLKKTMNLEEKYRPEKVEDLSYIIRIITKYQKGPSYSFSGKIRPGARQYVYVELYDTKKKAVIYKSSKAWGGKLKPKVSYFGIPDFVSGSDVSQKKKDALIQKALKKVN